MPVAETILVSIEVINALSEYAVPAIVTACKALNKDGTITMDDLAELKELVKHPDTYLQADED
nr:hypothetical protein [uncultured Pseudodesulfovibrio sp.]